MTLVKIKLLMVDVDGVIVNGRPEDGLPLFTYLERDLGVSPEALQREFFRLFWADIVVGREPMLPRLESILSHIAPHVSAQELADYWFKNDSRLDRQLLDDIAVYRSTGIRIVLATNQEHLRAQYLMRELGLSRHVDGIAYSAALGHSKPSAEFFRLAHAMTDLAAEEVAFIDDKLENVEAARDFGWRAAHWTGKHRLETVLSDLF